MINWMVFIRFISFFTIIKFISLTLFHTLVIFILFILLCLQEAMPGVQVVYPDDQAVLLLNGQTVRPRPFLRAVQTPTPAEVPAGFIPLTSMSLEEFHYNVPDPIPGPAGDPPHPPPRS